MTSMIEALERHAQHPLARLLLRLDSWTNEVTGFGTDRDKTMFGTVSPNARLSDLLLSALYHTDDMAARMVDIVPQEMLREGFAASFNDKTADAEIKNHLDELDVRAKVADGIRWARCYGGGGILLGCDDGREASERLRPELADDLKYLMVLDRRMLWPLEYYLDPTHSKFGKPKTYLVWMTGGPASISAVVHESRLVLFAGATTGIQERNQNMSWDYSVLQRPFEILRQFNTGWKSTELMLTDANQGIFKMSGLAKMIATGGMAALNLRMQLTDMYRSVVRAMIVDVENGEDFQRTSTSFEGIPNVLDKFMLRLSAAVQIPVTILMGQSPAGMNATGDSDFRWFYDRMRSEQTLMLEPRLRRIVDVMMQTRRWATKSLKDKPLTFTFPTLWKATQQEEAQLRATNATRDATYIQAQVLTPEEVALSRFTPTGYGEEIVLSDAARAARERVLTEDLDSMKGGAPAGDDGGGDGGDGGASTNDERTDAHRFDARTFVLQRNEDETGVSGTGEIAEGVLFEDGKVAMRWKTKTAATTLFDSIDDVLRVHGHGGKTELRWTDGKES